MDNRKSLDYVYGKIQYNGTNDIRIYVNIYVSRIEIMQIPFRYAKLTEQLLFKLDFQKGANLQWPLLLTWFNFHPSMDK